MPIFNPLTDAPYRFKLVARGLPGRRRLVLKAPYGAHQTLEFMTDDRLPGVTIAEVVFDGRAKARFALANDQLAIEFALGLLRGEEGATDLYFHALANFKACPRTIADMDWVHP